MLGKHVICDGCGEITLEASFEDGAYVDTDGHFPYDEIVSEEKTIIRQITGTDWARHGFPDPDDPIAINFEDYCPHCQEEP